jgi:predicted nuclease of predicted toxin-antitoxin system
LLAAARRGRSQSTAGSAGDKLRSLVEGRRVTAPDTEIMAYAREHGCIVLTHDLDFSAILAATGGTKSSVMQIRSENLNPDVVGEKIVSALWQMQVRLEAGALVSVEPPPHKDATVATLALPPG